MARVGFPSSHPRFPLEAALSDVQAPPSHIATPTKRSVKRSWTGTVLAASAAALAAAAVYNTYRAHKAEREHPPGGRFVTVEGVRLHYFERGEGPPVVLIHGNAVVAEDFLISGLFDRIAERHRVIAFDRPGYGYSERPRGAMWTAAQQAKLLWRACRQLGIERPVVAGHSWGTLVALEMALSQPDGVKGLLLLGGYYAITMRYDVPLVAPPAIPIVGDVLRYTVSPLIGAAMLPLAFKAMFAPRSVPDRFLRRFPRDFLVRPSQIRAEALDAVMMIPAATALRDRLHDLPQPVVIMAGTDDRIVDHESHSVWLHRQIPNSDLRLFPGVGHMVHYAAPGRIAKTIGRVAAGRVNGGSVRQAAPASRMMASGLS